LNYIPFSMVLGACMIHITDGLLNTGFAAMQQL